MKGIFCSLLIASVPFGSALADAPKPDNAKVTLVYQHELPNVPGKSIKSVLVEYGPGGYSPGHTHAKSELRSDPSIKNPRDSVAGSIRKRSTIGSDVVHDSGRGGIGTLSMYSPPGSPPCGPNVFRKAKLSRRPGQLFPQRSEDNG
jgi:hypothetical protein